MERLQRKIECLRQKMHITAIKKGISHPDVLMVSQRLDEAINEFYNVDKICVNVGGGSPRCIILTESCL